MGNTPCTRKRNMGHGQLLGSRQTPPKHPRRDSTQVDTNHDGLPNSIPRRSCVFVYEGGGDAIAGNTVACDGTRGMLEDAWTACGWYEGYEG
mmetsp:Transcript_39045/g.43727  ORF Transcript_39045/g.43727 Transcript_39045/m.43727 type:complete len:92 (+) Transcript_39045:426-701(+)